MEQKKFVALIGDLEVYARQHPAIYKLRVGILAALGYALLLGTIATVLLLVVACVYFGAVNLAVIQILLIPIGVAAVVLRSLWVEFPKPEGHHLRPSEAPRLFEVVSRIQMATKGPKVHKILLNQELNASIVQRPRLGMFGWHENYLMIGLPLLHGLSPDEVRAIIAHEFGHLSGKHSAFAGWIYRVRQTWFQVLANAQQHRRHAGNFLHKLFNWYVPYFSAYSFVLARATEFEADRCSVVMSGRQNAARALINLELKQRALDEEHWPEFFREADTQPEPPTEVFTRMLDAVRRPLTPEKAQAWFAQSLTRKHNYADTHPALGDRLEAIGYPQLQMAELETFVKSGNQRAYEYFLQSAPVSFIAEKNESWREDLRGPWDKRRAFVAEAKEALAALEAKSQTLELTVTERVERANLVARIGGKAAMIPLLREALGLEPDHVVANFALGDALLDEGDEAGIKHLEIAMERDIHSVSSACHSIFLFLAGRRRMDEAERYRDRARAYQQTVEQAREERNNVSHQDDFKPHGLAPDVLVALRAQLARYSNLASAHLVQKVVQHFPEDTAYVLGVVRKRPWYRSQGDNRAQQLLNDLAAGLTVPGYTQIIALEHKNYRPLLKVFSQIRGAEIYRAVT